jgi:glycerate-2-kinase
MALDILDYCLKQVNAREATKRFVTLNGNLLQVGERTFNLDRIRHIYVVGSGKATFPLAVALEEILADRITAGFISVKDGQITTRLSRIKVVEASHPYPDRRSYEAALKIVAIAQKAGAQDLVFCLMSGGVSALSVLPVEGIRVEDKIQANDLLVNSGAEIKEIMTVRRHLSQIKGGRLAEKIFPATAIALTVSDAIGDPMEWNTDWTHPDSSTLADAIAVLKKYGLWNKVSSAVQDFLTAPSPGKETPKTLDESKIYNLMVVKTRQLSEAAATRAEQLGLRPLILTSLLQGESREVGRTLASIAMEAKRFNHPLTPPCAIIATGETMVRIDEPVSGKGGRNQELAAGAALDLIPEEEIVICSLGTDGTDGPTEYAGGIVDGSTLIRAKKNNVDIYRHLARHDILAALKKTEDAIKTKITETNVCDISLCVVL